MVALLCPLAVSGCADKVFVTEPLALPAVKKSLMVDPGPSTCVLPNRELYNPGEIGAYKACIEAEREHVHKRLMGLQKAVRTREKIIDKALATKGQTS